MSETQGSEQVEHLWKRSGVKTCDGGGVHDWPQIHMVFPLSRGDKYSGDVWIARVGHPKEPHIHLAFPFSVELAEDLVLEQHYQLRSQHQTSHFTKGSVVIC